MIKLSTYRDVIVQFYKVKVYKVPIFQADQIAHIKQNPKIYKRLMM